MDTTRHPVNITEPTTTDRQAVAHDPDYCERFRPLGHVCNQPHAADNPHGYAPRWLRIQRERLAERERRGGSRYDAVADLTGTVAL